MVALRAPGYEMDLMLGRARALKAASFSWVSWENFPERSMRTTSGARSCESREAIKNCPECGALRSLKWESLAMSFGLAFGEGSIE
jgi:hypothetical protein